MNIFTRKDGEIVTPFTKMNQLWQYLAIFVTFTFTNLYILRGQFTTALQIYAELAETVILPTTGMFIAYILLNALVSTILLEVFLSLYYFLAFQSIRGLMPFTNREFKSNIRPFMAIRNVIWALLSATMFIEGDFFLGVGYVLFENLATMIIFLPAFFYMKKRYIKDGYSAKVLTSFAMPYLIITTFTIVGYFLY